MMSLQSDPVYNAVYNGIKRDIEVVLENHRWRAAIILIYAGMDAMAFLDMPDGQSEVTRDDFIRWADRYVHFPCEEQLTGADLYGARCSMLHAYGAVSRLSQAGRCRIIGYMDVSLPEVRYKPSVSTELVMVSVPALKEAFFRGIDQFLIDAFASKARGPLLEARLSTFVQVMPS